LRRVQIDHGNSVRQQDGPNLINGADDAPHRLGHGVYEDNVDYGIYCGDWCIGRIYETPHRPPADLPWLRALYAPSKPGTLRTDSRAATLDQAKAGDATTSPGPISR
jgi:hypothetical protein